MRFKDFLLEDKRPGTNASAGLEFQALVPSKSSEDVALALSAQHHSSDSAVKKSPAKWHVQADATLGKGGVEIHSPAEPLNTALSSLSKICTWLTNNAVTNDDTSLKIRIYIPNISEKLDAVKLVMFMGDNHPQTCFKQFIGHISEPQIEVIKQKLKQTGKLPGTAADLEEAALRYVALRGNHRRMPAGFLELRVKGGSGYEKDTSDLKKKIFKMVTAVEVACDPALEKGEYLQKLISLLTSEQTVSVTKNDMTALPEELHRIYLHSASINDAWKTFDKDQAHGDARQALLSMINIAVKTVKKLKTSLTLQEKMLFKRLARQVSLQARDVDEYYGSDHIARLNFKKDIGI